MKKKIIAIDMGHGGSDAGAVGVRGIQEKRVNYNVGMKLKELLEEVGFAVIMTRKADERIGINERAAIVNKAKADLCISIHHNAGGGDGFEIIHQISSGNSKRFAELVAVEFSKLNNKRRIFTKEGGPGKDYFGMLRTPKCPTIIAEFAFLDSPDVAVVDTYTEQWAEAKAVANAVIQYFK